MLQIRNLCKSYGPNPVLQNLNLSIAAGEIYGLLGSNGAGKTTTINILCHLLQTDSGSITLYDQPHSEATQSLIALVPQENLLYGSLTCEENLSFFARLYGLSKRQRQERIPACLKAVGLANRLKSPAETLSGGMQRRLSMAIALVHHPKLLILDEPTAGLDIDARTAMWRLIRQLQAQGMTILLTTHLLDEAERLCDRLGILKHGRLLAEGSLPQLRQRIAAQEIIVIKTAEEESAIARAQTLGFPHRRYGEDLAFWLPEVMELKDIIGCFAGILLTSIAREPVRLEHIYHEILRNPPVAERQADHLCTNSSTLSQLGRGLG
ncbi:ABC transporter ATP-binding protein [Romeria aff. gracilis LEGE 07310]|uniref:ABC transporter ATP-binding protein n=1 Tax=Vasconcelosia minhoensis LEGE 07310 TaxID=915328 RepID=A0A8J7AI27_9CYAN|nr:ABC transporter ATP-binding protein [Romeria gracilis]MBE9079349.1 ABC transporter ATP-binding protein [Romeria aff. gracilis LEGE 07310]